MPALPSPQSPDAIDAAVVADRVQAARSQATASQPALRTEGLGKRFGQITAVADLDLTLPSGELFGLVGPDGAGKTTTLRLLATLLAPSAGRAWVLGHDTLAEAEAIKPDIGYMAQRFALYRDLTVAENLAFFADAYRVPAGERPARLARLLAFARLEDFRDRRAEHLSGGMQKKLALACTLVHQPRLLLLDEPTTGVDPVSRREFWDILAELHLAGVSILVSTPYLDEAERCQRVGLLHQGRLLACEAPAAIRDRLAGRLVEVHGSPLRLARSLAADLPGVAEVQAHGDRLHLVVDDAAARAAPIAAALTAGGVTVHGARPARASLETAFIWLVRGQGTGS